MKLLSDSAERTGYLLKDRIGDVDEFVDAVRRVAAAARPSTRSSSRRCSRSGEATTRSPS